MKYKNMPMLEVKRSKKRRRGLKAEKLCSMVFNFFYLHASSGATHWETGWSIGLNDPVGTRASCLSSGPRGDDCS